MRDAKYCARFNLGKRGGEAPWVVFRGTVRNLGENHVKRRLKLGEKVDRSCWGSLQGTLWLVFRMCLVRVEAASDDRLLKLPSSQ